MNLYGFLRNNAVSRYDRLGLLTFSVGRYVEVFDMGTAPTAQMPGDTPTPDPAEAAAMTAFDWSIKSKCKCDKKNGKFYLWDTIINMHAVVHLRTSYASDEQQRWVREKEQDHVADINWWGRNEGKTAAQAQETNQEKVSFSDKAACEAAADAAMQNALRPSAREEVAMSKRAYDDNGSHTWPGP